MHVMDIIVNTPADEQRVLKGGALSLVRVESVLVTEDHHIVSCVILPMRASAAGFKPVGSRLATLLMLLF